MGEKLGLTLRERHRLRVFENRELRRTVGRNREEVAEHEAADNFIMGNFIVCIVSVINRVIKTRSRRLARHVARMGEMIDTGDILVGKPDGNR
jgi:hypothetical protein